MDEEDVTCACGASDDVGAITEHAVTALNDPTDTRDHTLSIPDPPQVAVARAEHDRLAGLRTQLEETTGLPVADIAAALRGY